MKHTQGEWKAKPYTRDQMMHKSMGGFNVVMNGQHIAALTENLTMPLTEVEANANLIAAAPELLEACNLVLNAWHSKISNMHKKEPEYLEIIRKAIKKANKSNTYEL